MKMDYSEETDAEYDDMYDGYVDDRRGFRDGRSRDYESDYSDDYYDGHNVERLSKSDMAEWKRSLLNADGTQGPHFSIGQVMQSAQALGIRFNDYDEKEFCMAMNMLYSDFCEAFRGFVSPEKESIFFAKMANAFLDDEDGPDPSVKLARYYHKVLNK